METSIKGAITVPVLCPSRTHVYSKHLPAKCSASPPFTDNLKATGGSASVARRRGQANARKQLSWTAQISKYRAPDDGECGFGPVATAFRNRSFFILVDGTQAWSFCYVDDLVEAIERLMANSAEVTVHTNFGTWHEASFWDRTKLVFELAASRSQITNYVLAQDDPKRRRRNIALAERLRRRQPFVPRQGLGKAIVSFERHLAEVALQTRDIHERRIWR
jgi:hypothetical protein